MPANRSAFMISAAHKSSGKTTLSIGIVAALSARGLAVQPFKKGPDYIDPMWLGQAAGRSCRNLDPYLTSFEAIRRVWLAHVADADVAVVEGNKGLYDGLALDGSNSNAALAKALGLPVVLVIDCRGMTRGIAPLLLGYQAFDADVRIAGVILNRVGGKRHEGKLRAVIAEYTQLPVLGAIPETPELSILERHLGLVPSNEATDAGDRIAALARLVEQHVDLPALLDATRLPANLAPLPLRRPVAQQAVTPLRIGIARDRAFGFYYPEDIEAMIEAGGEPVFFDTLRDEKLPPVDALFIGGGFPETLAATLESNARLRADIKAAIASGLPTYAECGGLMYLSRAISWQGRRYEMVGAIPGEISLHPKPVGRGYVEVEATAEHPWWPAGTRVKAHEFHYSRLDALDIGAPVFGWQMRRGSGIDGSHDGLRLGNLFASYTHLRQLPPASGPETPGCNWAAGFVAFAREVNGSRLANSSAQA